jgi:hypothetical protein
MELPRQRAVGIKTDDDKTVRRAKLRDNPGHQDFDTANIKCVDDVADLVDTG